MWLEKHYYKGIVRAHQYCCLLLLAMETGILSALKDPLSTLPLHCSVLSFRLFSLTSYFPHLHPGELTTCGTVCEVCDHYRETEGE